MVSSPHSDTTTAGIRVQAAAQFLPQDSDPEDKKFLFTYRITLTNVGERTAQLVSRHWVIVDADGKREVVRGPGVVGAFPRLAKGESYTYRSYCPLPTTWGTMEGSYTFQTEGGTFEVAIGRFFLVPTAPPLPAEPQRS